MKAVVESARIGHNGNDSKGAPMSLGEISQAVIEALTALFNGIADYPIAWDGFFILIGIFAAVFFYFLLFNLLIGPIKEAAAARKAAKGCNASKSDC